MIPIKAKFLLVESDNEGFLEEQGSEKPGLVRANRLLKPEPIQKRI